MTKLVDQFGTKYFADHYAAEVGAFLKEQAKNGNPVDLADARLCYSSMEAARVAAYDGCELHDSMDPEREAYFAENRRRRKRQLELEEIGEEMLYVPPTYDLILPYMHRLSSDCVYCLGTYGDPSVEAAYIVLVQAARPDVTIDLKRDVDTVMRMVYDNLFPNTHRWESFYVLRGTTFVEETPDANNYDRFIQSNVVVPTDFGRKRLLALGEWRRCLSRVSEIIEKKLRPKKRHIKDYL